MAPAEVDGLSLAHEVIGVGDRPWVITPGGRFTKESPGVRELAEELAAAGNRVLIWDRPNTGESGVSFTGDSESAMQADALAGLLVQLDMAPAMIAGGSGGSRVSLLTAARHPEVAAGLALWWISGGPFGLLSLAVHYCGESVRAAWPGGMEAVAALPDWAEVVERNPSNRARVLAQDPGAFVATLVRWMVAYCPCDDETVPGQPDAAEARALDVPALAFRSGESAPHHTRATSERLAELLPSARLVEPPWGDREWIERQQARTAGTAPALFVRWPLLAPTLLSWADEAQAGEPQAREPRAGEAPG